MIGTVLQVLGLILLLIVAALLGVVVFFAWKFRKMVRDIKGTIQGLASAAGPAPRRIHLEAMAAPSWDDEESVEELTAPLPGLGFRKVGDYQVREIPGFGLEAWVDPAKAITAVVYEHPAAGVWLDLVTQYEDGGRITYANTAQGGGVDHAPGHILERFDGLGTRALFERFVADRPDRPARPITAETFVAMFETAYAQEMDWRNSRGGATEDEIRAVAALSGETYSDDEVDAVRHELHRNAMHDLGETLRQSFLRESRMPASEWEEVRDRVVIIHDRLTPELMDEMVIDWIDEEDSPSTAGPDGSPRRAFAAFNDRRPPGERFRKLGEVKAPIEADVYCAPEA